MIWSTTCFLLLALICAYQVESLAINGASEVKAQLDELEGLKDKIDAIEDQLDDGKKKESELPVKINNPDPLDLDSQLSMNNETIATSVDEGDSNKATEERKKSEFLMNPWDLDSQLTGKINNETVVSAVEEATLYESELVRRSAELGKTNFAIRKPTSQSSIAAGGEASRAVDGLRRLNYAYGSCTHTNDEKDPYWTVNLEKLILIQSVVVYNRKDACCMDRLDNAIVYVDSLGEKTECGSVGFMYNKKKATVLCNGGKGIVGSRVTIKLYGEKRILSLCEVEVYGKPATSDCKTVSGPQVNKECKFPFLYNGKAYSKCKKWDTQDKFWCATDIDQDGKMTASNSWGNCNEALSCVEDCLTDGTGPSNGQNKQCKFPFTYDDKIYYSCKKWDTKDGYWCPTSLNNGKFISGEWGNCRSSCNKLKEFVDEKLRDCERDAGCNDYLNKRSNTRGFLEKITAGINLAGSIAETLAGETKPQTGDISGATSTSTSQPKQKIDFKTRVKTLAARFKPFLKTMGPMGELLTQLDTSTEAAMIQEVLDTLKTKFKEVNNRFDHVIGKIEDLKTFIQKIQWDTKYNDELELIDYYSEIMNKFQEQPNKPNRDRILTANDPVRFAEHIHKIIMNNGFIANLVKEKDSNKAQIERRLMYLYHMVQRSVKFALFWIDIKNMKEKEDKVPVNDQGYTKDYQERVRKEWTGTDEGKGKLQELRDRFDSIEDHYFKEHFIDLKWKDEVKDRLHPSYNSDKSPVDKAYDVYEFLTNKYDWRDWNVIVYTHVRGYDNHAFQWCGIDKATSKDESFDSIGGWNYYITNIDRNKAFKPQSAAINEMKYAKTSKTWCYSTSLLSKMTDCTDPLHNAKKTLDSISGCNGYSLKAVIVEEEKSKRQAVNVYNFYAARRCSSLNKDGMHMILCD